MPLIVDAYNVIHVTGILPPELAGLGVLELAEQIGSGRYRSERVWLVCDGRPKPGEPPARIGLVAIQYAGTAVEADERIEAMIAASTTPRRLIVVSSDARVRRAARARRCGVLRSEQFLEQLAADARRQPRRHVHRPSGPIAGGEVAQWIRDFGLSSAMLAIPSARTERQASVDAGSRSAADEPPRRDADRAPGQQRASPPHEVRPGDAPPRRPLEHVERLEEIDPDELESFDMRPWLEEEDSS